MILTHVNAQAWSQGTALPSSQAHRGGHGQSSPEGHARQGGQEPAPEVRGEPGLLSQSC